MEWADLCALLMRARDSLCLQGGRPHPGWLSTQTQETTRVAEKAQRHFAEYDEWPADCSGVVRYQIWMRLLFALDWILMHADAGMPVPASLAYGDVRQAFLDAVIDDWNVEGIAWLAMRFPALPGDQCAG